MKKIIINEDTEKRIFKVLLESEFDNLMYGDRVEDVKKYLKMKYAPADFDERNGFDVKQRPIAVELDTKMHQPTDKTHYISFVKMDAENHFPNYSDEIINQAIKDWYKKI